MNSALEPGELIAERACFQHLGGECLHSDVGVRRNTKWDLHSYLFTTIQIGRGMRSRSSAASAPVLGVKADFGVSRNPNTVHDFLGFNRRRRSILGVWLVVDCL